MIPNPCAASISGAQRYPLRDAARRNKPRVPRRSIPFTGGLALVEPKQSHPMNIAQYIAVAGKPAADYGSQGPTVATTPRWSVAGSATERARSPHQPELTNR